MKTQNKLICKLKELDVKIITLVKVLPISRSTFYVYVGYYENEFEHELLPNDIIKLFNLIMHEAKTWKDVYDYAYDIFKYIDYVGLQNEIACKKHHEIACKKHPVEIKLLCDYTTDELLEEIKRRINR